MTQRALPFFLLINLLACQQRPLHTDQTTPDSAVYQASLIQSVAETARPVPNMFLIIPGQQAGPVNATATEASLTAMLGADQVRRDTIYVAEGAFEIGTTLFKNTANQAQILWLDKQHFARPAAVLIRPARDEHNNLLPGTTTRWITDKGVRLGMSLRAVEKLNGRTFSIYGFGWDYGGLSSGWKGGALEQKDSKTFLSMGFGVPESLPGPQERLYESLLGDGEFLSSHPAMQQLNPTIQTLTISFR